MFILETPEDSQIRRQHVRARINLLSFTTTRTVTVQCWTVNIYGDFTRQWMQVVVIVLLHRGVYAPFILAHLFAFLNITMIGSFFTMLKTVGRALISHLPRFFRLTDWFNLPWDFQGSLKHLCLTLQSADLSFSHLMTYIYMSYRTANLQMLHFIYLFNKYTYWIF